MFFDDDDDDDTVTYDNLNPLLHKYLQIPSLLLTACTLKVHICVVPYPLMLMIDDTVLMIL